MLTIEQVRIRLSELYSDRDWYENRLSATKDSITALEWVEKILIKEGEKENEEKKS